MSDKKISQLSSATTPLAGTEVVPVVQGGVTKKVPVSDLTAGRDVSIKTLTVTDNVVIGLPGKGVDFSTTPNFSGMTSELLSDYEEGVCSLAISDGTTSTSAQTFEYTKIGRVVIVKVAIYAANVTALNASSGLRLTGFPFTIGGTYGMPNTLFQPKFGGVYAEGASGATYAGLYSASTAQDGTAITVTSLGAPSTMSIFGCFAYQV